MADYPYSPNPASVPKFLDHIQSGGTPTKVTQTYLGSVGFKSTNDRKLIGIFKAIGFLDSSGVPTQIWQDYRDKTRARSILGAAVRKGYSELFKTFPDADRKDNEALRNFFSAHTTHAQSTLGKLVQTFKALCEKADFGVALAEEAGAVESPVPPSATPTPAITGAGPTININIQLQLPETGDASTYDNLFAAMKKHLFPDGSTS